MRELAELAGTDDQIDVRRAAEDRFLVFLRHAAHHADDQLRPMLLERLEPARARCRFYLPHVGGRCTC